MDWRRFPGSLVAVELLSWERRSGHEPFSVLLNVSDPKAVQAGQSFDERISAENKNLTHVLCRPNIFGLWPPLPHSSGRCSATIASSNKLVQVAWVWFTVLTMSNWSAM